MSDFLLKNAAVLLQQKINFLQHLLQNPTFCRIQCVGSIRLKPQYPKALCNFQMNAKTYSNGENYVRSQIILNPRKNHPVISDVIGNYLTIFLCSNYRNLLI